MPHLIAILYGIISLLFASNLVKLYKKHRDGNKKITLFSLLATVSLVVSFAALTLYFIYFNPWIVLVAQTILLTTMLSILFKNSAKG